MRRPSDTFSIGVQGDTIDRRELVAGKDFRADFLSLSDSLGIALRSLELDLLRIAAGIYAVDRLARRPRLTTTSYPSRNLELTFHVSDVAFWRSNASLIVEPLRFLSDDQFELKFVESPTRNPWLVAPSLFADDSNEVALLSGGLDSTAGLIAHLAQAPNTRLLTVTVEHQPHQRRRVSDQIAAMPLTLRRRVVPTFTRATLIDAGRIDRQERTQRLRGFLFASLGGVVAARLGLSTVNVYETGVGAVNIPPLEGMTAGGLATRGAHPHFLRLMGQLVSTIAGTQIRFQIPFKWYTKGEMTRLALNAGGAGAISRSVSCVHYPLRQPGAAKQCGTCPACIGHRIATYSAGTDVTDCTFARDPRILRPDVDDAMHARLLRGQIYELKDLARSYPNAFSEHLWRTVAVTTRDTIERWADLHVRHFSEAIDWLDASSMVAADELTVTDDGAALIRTGAFSGAGVQLAC